MSLTRLPGISVPFSGFFRQLEQEMETVIKVLQPGPLGIQHKFSAEERRQAKGIVERAIKNWKKNATMEMRVHI